MPRIDLPIKIDIEMGEAGLVHLTSPTHPEIFISGTSIAEVVGSVPHTIAAINRAHDLNSPPRGSA